MMMGVTSRMIGLGSDFFFGKCEIVDNLVRSKYKENSAKILVDSFHKEIWTC